MSAPTLGSAEAPADTAPAMEPLSEAELAQIERVIRRAEWAGGQELRREDVPLFRRLFAQGRRAASGSLPGGEREAVAACIYGYTSYDFLYARKISWGQLPEDDYERRKALKAADAVLALSAPPPPAVEPPVLTAERVKEWAKDPRVQGAVRAERWPTGPAPQPGGAEAKKLREALTQAANALECLAAPGGNMREYRQYAGAEKAKARAALATPPGDTQERAS